VRALSLEIVVPGRTRIENSGTNGEKVSGAFRGKGNWWEAKKEGVSPRQPTISGQAIGMRNSEGSRCGKKKKKKRKK